MFSQAFGWAGGPGMAGDGGVQQRHEGEPAEDDQGDCPLPHGPQRWGRGLRSPNGDWEAGLTEELCGWKRLSSCLSVPHKVN